MTKRAKNHPVFDKARNERGDSDYAYLDATDTAKLVRSALKREFPGVKFSVRTDKYSGGSSVDVSWTDGPRTAEVDAVIRPYAMSGFDGMIDMQYSYTNWLYPNGSIGFAETKGTEGSMGVVAADTGDPEFAHAVMVKGGADYVMGQRELSNELRDKLKAQASERYSVDGDYVTLPDGDREWLGTVVHRLAEGSL